MSRQAEGSRTPADARVLRRAHYRLDRAVDRLCRRPGFASEERVEHLLGLYEKMVRPLPRRRRPGGGGKPESRDFLYQINRRRRSSVVHDLTLNRLSKWATQWIQDFVLSADGALIPGSERVVCRLELDMNSVPSPTPLPQNALRELFGELLQLGGEIANEGDIE